MRLLFTLHVLAGSLMAQLFPFPGPGSVGLGPAVWTHIQDNYGTSVTSGTTVTVTLTSAPTAGNLVVCSMWLWPRQAPTSVQDNAASPHTYTVTPHSPAATLGSQSVSLAYLAAPAAAGTTITATVGTTISATSLMGCAEFHKSYGTPTLDVDAAGSGGGTGITLVNTPSVTVAGAGELLVTGIWDSLQCTTYNSPWVRWTANSPQANTCAAFVLSASAGSNAVNISQSSGGSWNSMLAAFL